MNTHIRVREWWGDYQAHDDTFQWDNWTPEDALIHRLKRFRDAGQSVRRDGLSLHVTHTRTAPDGSAWTEQLDFKEAPPSRKED